MASLKLTGPLTLDHGKVPAEAKADTLLEAATAAQYQGDLTAARGLLEA